LLISWSIPPSSYGDLVANLLLYIPFGLFGALTVRAHRSVRLSIVIAAGLLLSVAVELTQFYDASRVTNMSDVYLNTTGTVIGAFAAVFWESLPGVLPTTRIAPDPIPVMLLVAMLGYHLFPYVPTIDLHKYWHAVRPLIQAPTVDPPAIIRYAALWLTSAWLLGKIFGYSRSCAFIVLLIAFVFFGKIVIENLALSLPEVLGAVIAVVLWLIIGGHDRLAVLLVATVLCIAVLSARLEPFHFRPPERPFGWLPFRSFLGGSLSVNVTAFLEKFFLYGSLIWLFVDAGLPLWAATTCVAVLLLITSFGELYLPGRSAEITDATVALIIGLIMAPMRMKRTG
jgi:VanZ family protein